LAVVAWIIFLLVVVPMIALLAWALLDESFVRIEPGKLGLLLVRGKATDKSLDPGVHFVPALRRRMVQEYPSLELSFRAGDDEVATESELERAGPSLRATLGDRATARISYTVRFRLDQGQLKTVHDRFGPEGIWAVARDESARTIRNALADPGYTVDDLFGTARHELETQLGEAVREAFRSDGLVLTTFSLGDVDLGRTGDVIQATTRARFDLAREEAESATRVARARNDADLGTYLTGDARDAVLRYREVDVWRELVQSMADRSLVPPGLPYRPPSATSPSNADPAAAAAAGEQDGRPAIVEPSSAADEQ
jgi:regulator of protease activity HflC (stomatin/prohibitin superfamily)